MEHPARSVAAKEASMKQKMERYYAEAFRMGNVRGFQHFHTYVRGKEEMTLTVHHEPQISSRRCSIVHNPVTEVTPGESLTSSRLPYDKQTLVLSQGTQMSLSGLRDQGVGLPPASPSDNEQQSINNCFQDSNSTVFLLAGYSRYACPYVWVRSNHHRLMTMSGAGDGEKDHPLRLKSTSKWIDGDVFIWDIVAELVKLCMYPSPHNPFAVDMKYFQSLSPQQQILASSAMIVLLQKIVITASDEKPYLEKVLEDLFQVSRLHYTTLLSLVTSHQFPAFHLRGGKNEGDRASRRRSASSLGRQRYPNAEQHQQRGQHENMTVQSTRGVYTPQGSAQRGFPGYGFTPAPSLF